MDWQSKNIYYQMGNIGSEIGRALKWQGHNPHRAVTAADRALYLIDQTINDPKNNKCLKELTRLREIFAETFYGENIYGESEKTFDRYFYPYTLAANRK